MRIPDRHGTSQDGPQRLENHRRDDQLRRKRLLCLRPSIPAEQRHAYKRVHAGRNELPRLDFQLHSPIRFCPFMRTDFHAGNAVKARDLSDPDGFLKLLESRRCDQPSCDFAMECGFRNGQISWVEVALAANCSLRYILRVYKPHQWRVVAGSNCLVPRKTYPFHVRIRDGVGCAAYGIRPSPASAMAGKRKCKSAKSQSHPFYPGMLGEGVEIAGGLASAGRGQNRSVFVPRFLE